MDVTSGEYNRDTDYTFRFAIRFTEPMNKSFAENVNSYALKGEAGKVLQVEKAKLLSDEQTLILDLSVATTEVIENYEEYSLIHMDDLAIHFKNLVDKQGLPLGGKYITNADGEITIDRPKHENDPLDGRNDVQFEYKDEIKPKLKEYIATRLDRNGITTTTGSEFGNYIYTQISNPMILELTFTEAIEKNQLNNIQDLISVNSITGGGSNPIEKNNYIATLDPSNAKKVRLTFANTELKDDGFIANHTIYVVSMKKKDDVNQTDIGKLKDIAGNTISIVNSKGEIIPGPISNNSDGSMVSSTEFINNQYPSAHYVYRAMPTEIFDISLNKVEKDSNYEDLGGGKASSSILDVYLKTRYAIPDGKYYFIVSSNTEIPMPEVILNPEQNGQTVYGTGTFDSAGEKLQFILTGNARFLTGQNIFIVGTDSYGNLTQIFPGKIEK